MSGIKTEVTSVRFNNNKVTPDELDRYETYVVTNPTSSATWVGTSAGGTSTQAKALVLVNTYLDYPRNLLYSLVGTNDAGGTWTINGVDQFGVTITESVGSGTVAAGTPAFATAGTKIFAKVTTGTFTHATGQVGLGSARIGVAVGGTAGSTATFGLRTKIKAVTDVKSITHSKNFVVTTLDGGTISSTLVGTANHTFNGTAALGTADTFTVTIRPSWNNEASGQDLAR
jgi:hypothetical protein